MGIQGKNEAVRGNIQAVRSIMEAIRVIRGNIESMACLKENKAFLDERGNTG